ncbi:dynamin family protein [Paenibacillus taichungensis]|uniref:dynamin family protein n=1 Tax=Paenibacillus taichungensis TaxID=484184 RepID=UPI0038D0AE2B
MFRIKDYREQEMKISQEELGELIGLSKDEVSQLEESAEPVKLDVLVMLANATGTTLDSLVGFKPKGPQALEIEDTWEVSRYAKNTIMDYISNKGSRMVQSFDQKYAKQLKDLKGTVASLLVKPRLAVVGMSDAGKSRLINSLLGDDKMPASWTPTTSIIVHIKHIEDKPPFMDKDVYIFRERNGRKAGFEIGKMDNESHCLKYMLDSGGSSLLSRYGTRQGDKYSHEEAGTAVVFADSPILKVCDILDLPGFGTGDRVVDDKLARKAHSLADIVVYLSIANGFLRGTDIEFLKSVINSLPPLDSPSNHLHPLENLFIVASQAHTVDQGNMEELHRILEAGSQRLFREVPEDIWTNRKDITGHNYSPVAIARRFFTYSTDTPALRKNFETQIKILLEKLPIIQQEKVQQSLTDQIHHSIGNLEDEIEQYFGILNDREKYKKLLKELKEKEPQRLSESQNLRIEVETKIKEIQEASILEFTRQYSELITADQIVKVIKDKGYKKKKEDVEFLTGYLNSSLQAKMQGILKEKSFELKHIIDKYLKDFDETITKHINIDINSFQFSFNATGAFAGGLAGATAFGGLAIWASTMGNLGAYILVAKGVSFLSAIGISVAGGTAGAAAAVAALGGPVVLGVAIAIISALAVFSLFSGSWRSGLAKKLIQKYEEHRVLSKYRSVIDEFWLDTVQGFIAGVEATERDYQEYVANIERMALTYDTEKIKRSITEAEELTRFYNEIPLGGRYDTERTADMVPQTL